MENEFLEKNIQISKVYYCPYHKDAVISKYKIDSFDRKPKPGMILKAIKEHNIDPTKSVFIGDKNTDEEACKNAGVEKFIKFEKNKYGEYPDKNHIATIL